MHPRKNWSNDENQKLKKGIRVWAQETKREISKIVIELKFQRRHLLDVQKLYILDDHDMFIFSELDDVPPHLGIFKTYSSSWPDVVKVFFSCISRFAVSTLFL